jgi:uncharacterized membrane protein YagU involved in acid resistance
LATGDEPDRLAKRWLGTAAHYALGASVGAGYGLLAQRSRSFRVGTGVFYGVLVWVVADEIVTPALGLSRGPRELPPGVHLYSLLAHCVFGASLDLVYRMALAPSASMFVSEQRRALPRYERVGIE